MSHKKTKTIGHINIDDIYKEYGVTSIQYLFAGTVIDKMANNLVKAHNSGLKLQFIETVELKLPLEYDKFKKMLKIGVPIAVIASKMKSNGLDPSKILTLDDDSQVLIFIPFLENVNLSTIDLKKSKPSFQKNKYGNTLLESLKDTGLHNGPI